MCVLSRSGHSLLRPFPLSGGPSPPYALDSRQRPPRRTQTDCHSRSAVALACALWNAALQVRSLLLSICDGLQCTRRCALRDPLFNFNIGNGNAASTHRKQRRLRQRSKGRRPRFPIHCFLNGTKCGMAIVATTPIDCDNAVTTAQCGSKQRQRRRLLATHEKDDHGMTLSVA